MAITTMFNSSSNLGANSRVHSELIELFAMFVWHLSVSVCVNNASATIFSMNVFTMVSSLFSFSFYNSVISHKNLTHFSLGSYFVGQKKLKTLGSLITRIFLSQESPLDRKIPSKNYF